MCDRPRYGYWELRPSFAAATEPSGLVQPGATPLLDAGRLLEGIHQRTQQVVLLHTHTPLTSERVCIATAGAKSVLFGQELGLTPKATEQLRQAPLDFDAPGLVMLANLAGHDSPLRGDLRQIRSAQVALTDSPLPGWILVSVPLRRLPGAPAMPGAEPRVVAAVSVLAPKQAHGAPLIAYGRMLHNAVRAAVETSVVIRRPRAATRQAA
ncbi:hypothetical protein ACF07Y_39555 [Streptomyces sp. NPDC016566]|uniref:hypothetical protein n=1 Tax=Streptomyces sp. NPDC016566 TaxID=3364967 RepID=UPI0036FC4BEB